MKITKQHAEETIRNIDGALVNGKGNPVPGQMCIMHAISCAFGVPNSDDPECVGSSFKNLGIKLNDCKWSNEVNRADGLMRFGVASIGSDSLNQLAAGQLLFLRGTQKLLPFVFRVTAERVSKERKQGYLDHAKACERVTTFEEAKVAVKNASASASASAYAYAYASAYASAYAYAYASASAYAYAYADADEKIKKNDKFLRMTADVAVEVLKEMKSPGCKYLYLCDAAKVVA